MTATSLAPRTARPSTSKSFSTWEICATIVIIGFGLCSVIQLSLYRAYESNQRSGIPIDFPHYFVAGTLARLRPPDNQLYFPPVDQKAQSYFDLRIDVRTPYGRPPLPGGLPAGAIYQPFDAPPFAALLMAPLTFFGWKTAYAFWQFLCTILLLASVYLALRLAHSGSPPPLVIAISLLLGLLFEPFRLCLTYGNIDVLSVFLWVLGIFLLRRERISASAFSLALGTMVKLSPAYAVPLFFFRRQWRWLAWYGVWCGALLGASVWKLGWHNHLVWATQVAPALACGIKGWENRSIAGLVLAFHHVSNDFTNSPAPASFCLINRALSALVYCASLVWCWKRGRNSQDLTLQLVLLPLVVLLVSPISWMQYYLLAVPALVFLWGYFRDHASGQSKLPMALLTASTLIISTPLPEYRLVHLLGKHFVFLPFAAWVAATLVLFVLGMKVSGSVAHSEC